MSLAITTPPPELEVAEPTGYSRHAPLRKRVHNMLIALMIEALIIVALLGLGAYSVDKKIEQIPLILKALSGAHSPSKHTTQHQAASAKSEHQTVKPQPPQPIPPKSAFIQMSKSDFDASDISKLSHKSDNGSGKNSGATYGPGEGPGGAQLFNAEWYREPTHGELAYYFPNGVSQDSWAIIACQTAPHYHVENCEALSESPPGSGYAKSLREAAWQFLVRPPMRDDKPIIGAWVKIRFTWNKLEEDR